MNNPVITQNNNSMILPIFLLIIFFGSILFIIIKWFKNRNDKQILKENESIPFEKRVIIFITNAIGFGFLFAIVGIFLAISLIPNNSGAGYIGMQYGMLIGIIFALIKAIFYKLFKKNNKKINISIIVIVVILIITFMILDFIR